MLSLHIQTGFYEQGRNKHNAHKENNEETMFVRLPKSNLEVQRMKLNYQRNCPIIKSTFQCVLQNKKHVLRHIELYTMTFKSTYRHTAANIH